MNRPKIQSANHLTGSCLPVGEMPIALQSMLKEGLALLWRGHEYARDLDAEDWEFAIDGEALSRTGLSDIDLRWLIARNFVACTPKATADEARLSFDPKNANFILTKSGAAMAWQVISGTLQPDFFVPPANGKNNSNRHLTDMLALAQVEAKPSWNRDRKELRYGESIIKQFRWAAANQETILMAFEEDGWPPRIDDPLPQKLNHSPKSRLHDTIKCLNRNHKKRLIRFNGDGTGEGVIWTLVNGTEPGV